MGLQPIESKSAIVLPAPTLLPGLPSPPAMPFFRKPYKSEITSFIEELKTRKPTLESEQRAGRALLWDRPVDRSAQAEWHDAAVPQQAYVYQTKPGS
jgi:hypothetical protein